MNINSFESEVGEKILARGKKYFEDGAVSDIWSEEPSQYCTVVGGSSLYDVEIHLTTEGTIQCHSCDCPYDWGEYCKHEVAVLLAIRDHLAIGSPLKRQGRKQGIHAKLSQLSKDDLLDLVYYLAKEYDLREDIRYYLEDHAKEYGD